MKIHGDLWPLFFTGKMACVAYVGVVDVRLGEDFAESESIDHPRKEPVFIHRVSFAFAQSLTREDAAACGFLNENGLQNELIRQNSMALSADSPVTLAYFQRRRETV